MRKYVAGEFMHTMLVLDWCWEDPPIFLKRFTDMVDDHASIALGASQACLRMLLHLPGLVLLTSAHCSFGYLPYRCFWLQDAVAHRGMESTLPHPGGSVAWTQGAAAAPSGEGGGASLPDVQKNQPG